MKNMIDCYRKFRFKLSIEEYPDAYAVVQAVNCTSNGIDNFSIQETVLFKTMNMLCDMQENPKPITLELLDSNGEVFHSESGLYRVKNFEYNLNYGSADPVSYLVHLERHWLLTTSLNNVIKYLIM